MGLFGGIGSIISGIGAKDSARKAATDQEDAIRKQQVLLAQLTPEALNDLAVRADRARVFNRLALQGETDPELLALRKLGEEQLLQQAQTPLEAQPSSILSRELFNEVKTENPQTTALKEQLFKNAEEELKAGATLPPEFQAELVRSGLNTGSQAGIKVGASTTGGNIARLLGAAGIQLKNQREQTGAALGAAAQNLQNSRYNILATIFPTLQQSENMKKQTAAGEFQFANGALPESGLSGLQEVNAKIGNVTAQNNLLGQMGQVKANKILAQQAANNQIIGGAADTLDSATSLAATSGIFGGGGTSFGIPGGGGASLNTGTYGSRTPSQQYNFNYLQSLYQ